MIQAKRASCITSVQSREPYLFGKDILIGIIDSGIDFYHFDFRNADGTTRINYLWDQTRKAEETSIFSREDINEALSFSSREEAYAKVPSRDFSGHGTAVAGIAAGNGMESEGAQRGVAPEAELIIVKLGNPGTNDFPKTTELMTGINFCIEKALEVKRPIAVNISFGNTYGSHTGDSILETYIQNAASVWKNVICIGSGNEGASGGHTDLVLGSGEVGEAELAVGEYDTGISIQIWKNYADDAEITLISPSGESFVIGDKGQGTIQTELSDTKILIFSGSPTPYFAGQEIYISLLPKRDYIRTGIWRIRIQTGSVSDGTFRLYLPSESAIGRTSRFLLPTPEGSFTIPSAVQAGISVGAYNSRTDSYADFSGRGFENLSGTIWNKPDIAAPGVGITSTKAGGGYGEYTGTSFATPFVTGSSALLMEWGIVKGNDPYLYGEKVKAYLIRGARKLPGFEVWPNEMVGYGALCVASSLPT
ncbi:peptidase S8 [bacterium C-53]|nr:peptidase S8 [Lachnospiraceae bacterium]NBI02238.1 peptidase S8 [Lachnospiraceae bacterium]RKJ11808.1 peptidase S8 [bacterium C-53]